MKATSSFASPSVQSSRIPEVGDVQSKGRNNVKRYLLLPHKASKNHRKIFFLKDQKKSDIRHFFPESLSLEWCRLLSRHCQPFRRTKPVNAPNFDWLPM